MRGALHIFLDVNAGIFSSFGVWAFKSPSLSYTIAAVGIKKKRKIAIFIVHLALILRHLVQIRNFCCFPRFSRFSLPSVLFLCFIKIPKKYLNTYPEKVKFGIIDYIVPTGKDIMTIAKKEHKKSKIKQKKNT